MNKKATFLSPCPTEITSRNECAIFGSLFLALSILSFSQAPGQIRSGNTREYNMSNRYWPVGGGKALNFNLPGLMDTGYHREAVQPTPYALDLYGHFAYSRVRVKTDLAITDRYTGVLLFSFDGNRVYNRNQQVMPHGDSILGGIDKDYNSFILPFPEDEDKYYLISYYDDLSNFKVNTAFYSSIIDMRLNNGLGDIVDTLKNIPRATPTLTRKRASVQGPQFITGKNNDYWLLLNETPGDFLKTYGADSLKVFAYHIDSNGISQEPVVSYIRSFHILGMKIKQAPDQSYLIIMGRFWSTEAEVATFDYTTGQLKTHFSLPYGYLDEISYYYKGIRVPFPFDDIMTDLEFSSDSKKVYIMENKQDRMSHDFIVTQLDFSELDSTKVMASKKVLDTLETLNPENSVWHLRRIDDTIFAYDVIKNDIDCILYANTDSAKYIKKHRTFNDSIAEYYPYLYWTSVRFPTGSAAQSHTAQICKKGERNFEPSVSLTWLMDIKADVHFKWSDGYSQLQRPLDTGSYLLTYNYFSGTCRMYVTDTFRIGYVGLDKPIIQVREKQLRCMQDYENYQWYRNDQLITGATNKMLVVTENGDYKVAVDNGSYCSDTSEVYPITNITNIADTKRGKSISIYPNPTQDYVTIKSPIPVTTVIKSVDGRELLRVHKASRINLSGWASGMYLLQLLNEDGILCKEEKLVKY